MRTTIDIDDRVLREIRRIHEREGRSIGAIVSDLLADSLARRRSRRQVPALRWASRSMNARINLDDKGELYRALKAHRS